MLDFDELWHQLSLVRLSNMIGCRYISSFVLFIFLFISYLYELMAILWAQIKKIFPSKRITIETKCQNPRHRKRWETEFITCKWSPIFAAVWPTLDIRVSSLAKLSNKPSTPFSSCKQNNDSINHNVFWLELVSLSTDVFVQENPRHLFLC